MRLAQVLQIMEALSCDPPRAWARAILAVAHTRADVITLAVIGAKENGYIRGVPFGITAAYRPGMTLWTCARIALQSMRRGVVSCGNLPRAWGRFRYGYCTSAGPYIREVLDLTRIAEESHEAGSGRAERCRSRHPGHVTRGADGRPR